MISSGAFLALALATLHAQRPTDLVNKRLTAQVVGVIDGDTVDILIPPARRVRVRLDGVDTPESGEPFSQQARTFTRVPIFSRDVQVTGKDVDTYGRLVARIVSGRRRRQRSHHCGGDRVHVPAVRVGPGAGRGSGSRVDRAARLLGRRRPAAPACVAREARTRSTPTPHSATTTGLIGNVSSKVDHLPTCRNATCKNCTRKFATRAEAEDAGFRPAGDQRTEELT